MFSNALYPLAVGALLRIGVFILTHGLTYDGTYYLRQAERILRGTLLWEGFPPGYPLLIAGLQSLSLDAVAAARLLSLLAGTVSIALVYALARSHVGPRWAWMLALGFALHPVFLRLDTAVLTESTYVFLVLSGFWLFQKRQHAWSGLPLGFAYLVRPEALALILGLPLAAFVFERRRAWGCLLVALLFVGVYAGMVSRELGGFMISPKQGALDLGPEILPRLKASLQTTHFVIPLIFLPLGLIEGVRTRSLLLVPVLYWFLLPLYDIHIQQRMHAAATPFLAILSLAFIVKLEPTKKKWLVWGSVALFVIGTAREWPNLFRQGIMTPHAKSIGEHFKPLLDFEDRVGSRFPFVAYYAGCGIVRFPLLSYFELMEHLIAAKATHLLLLESEMSRSTPHLRMMFDNPAWATAEGRLWPLARFDRIPGAGALLYEFRPAALNSANTTLVAEGVEAFAWRGNELYIASQAKELAVSPAGARQIEVREVNGRRQLVLVSPDGQAEALEITQGLEPLSPSWIGDDVLFVAQTTPSRLMLLQLPEKTLRPVTYEGVGSADATPVYVSCRGDDIALTYVPVQRNRPADYILATATWPADVSRSNGEASPVVMPGRWATLQQLAHPSVAWAADTDYLLATVLIASSNDAAAGDKAASSYESLALISASGQFRRLSFDIERPRRPRVRGRQIAFLAANNDLVRGVLAAEALDIPRPLVFDSQRVP